MSEKVKTCLSHRGYVVRKSMLEPAELKAICKELTVEPKVMPDYKKADDISQYPVFKENENKIYIPRYYGLERFGAPEVFSIPEGANINLEFTVPLRPIQEPIVSEYLEIARTEGGGIISLSCGGGKTVLGLYIISKLGKKALIVAHKEFLINQWIERIQEFLPEAKIGIIKGKKCITEGKDIVVSSIQSLWMKDYPETLMREFGLVIYDECHHVSARQFSKALMKTCFRYTLGLSATPQRGDGLERVFKWYLGKIITSPESNKPKKKDNVIVQFHEYNNNDPKYSKYEINIMKKPNNPKMITNITNCLKRNKYILSIARNLLIDEGRRVLILTERLNQVDWMLENLKAYEITVGKYVGGMKPELLDVAKKAQCIVGTFSMIEEGFDHKELDTLMMITPKTSVGSLAQSIGRILRREAHMRDKIPTVIDICDQFANFKLKGINRKKYYKKQGYSIENIRIEDDKDHSVVFRDPPANTNLKSHDIPDVLQEDKNENKNSSSQSSSDDETNTSSSSSLSVMITSKEKAKLDTIKRAIKNSKKERNEVKFSDE